MTKQDALKWIKTTFAEDILKEAEDGFDKGSLRLMPSMEAESYLIVYNHYTGEDAVNTSRPGTGNRTYISAAKMSDFAGQFCEVLDSKKSKEENIKAMIEETTRKNKVNLLVAYLNLVMDRMKYPNFVDVRMIFHNVYNAYMESYSAELDNRAEALEAISLINAKFEKFATQEEVKKLSSTEYAKEFFCG